MPMLAVTPIGGVPTRSSAMATRQRSITATASLGSSAGEQHDELVATVAADDVVLARRVGEHAGHRDEQRVAGRMAVRVVDRLEAIEVDDRDGEALGGAAGLRDESAERVFHQAAVPETGEGIGGRARLRDGQQPERGEHGTGAQDAVVDQPLGLAHAARGRDG